ncbi:SDR family NAD(P)-dependent oxidoreductase [Terrilactibacillus laevilacticus]|uniref:SDR family NAD(P)-dependent oxidoreductase n=1 Tax=Terrilactibacillus laevilacticus TaxID=1380157 RepID=A0ABW5PRL0_9BACI|nr:SDR family oxidoreductase [Terrilactibacillus laevilacticus]
MKLLNKVALITGVAPGDSIGGSIAQLFAREGAGLFISYFNEDKTEMGIFKGQLEQHSNKVFMMEGDVSNEGYVQHLVHQTIKQFGKIDVLVNCAGISTPRFLTDMSTEIWDQMINVNLRSVFLTTKEVIPHMISAESGRVINIASQVGQKGSVEHTHYAAAKAGVIGFTKSLALEVGKYNITANCIAPGPIQTQLMNEVDEAWRDKKLSELAIPRFGHPREVAPTALLLASDPDGNLYTGQTLGPNLGDVML